MRISDWSSDVCSSDLANTVEVEAESLDAALERAIERANGDPHWKALDHCGPTFVDAVAEGADADPWSGFGSALPIPDPIGRASCRERVCKYGSISVVAVALKKKTIIIAIHMKSI